MRHILEVRREALMALTERLIEVEAIAAEELERIVDEHSPGPVVVPGTLDAPARSPAGGTVESSDSGKPPEARSQKSE